MALPIIRFRHHNNTFWGLLNVEQVQVLDIPCTSTGDLIQLGRTVIIEASSTAHQIPVSEITLLSPITQDAKVLCQGANYRQHMIDSGMNPDAKDFNMFFTKSSASITNPVGRIIRPKHVELLDYEIELALVLGANTHSAVNINDSNLHEYIAGICIGNDISARDIQIPQMQFHKGKSYRTFCPLGPVLCLLEQDEMHYLNELSLTLKVNGEIRQQDSTANLVFKPAETLTEFSQITNFAKGDVLMTGTPSGCALGLPSATMLRIAALLPEKKKWQLFLKGQKKRKQYLNVGDIVESTITSADGHINLGIQTHTVTD